MKTFENKLRELPIETLRGKIEQQNREIEIAKHDLEIMKYVLAIKTGKKSNEKREIRRI
ncbi:MAG: hypothetical protein PHN44_09365 [Candidatus Marinimicrobia bacterium]|nr:hypothetical protein [Candidatus Neomarinimicrobiota bacterium]